MQPSYLSPFVDAVPQPVQEAFDAAREETGRPDALLARVVAVHRELWELVVDGPSGPVRREAGLTGRFREALSRPADYPAVGDWAAVLDADDAERALILGVMPRSSILMRKQAGNLAAEQPFAVNVDFVLIVGDMAEDFSPRRFERYLTLAWDAGARPVLVLTKLDLAEVAGLDIQALVREAESVSFGAPVIVTSADDGRGLDDIRRLLPKGSCAVLVGSSGVGKSSLVNALSGETVQATAPTRESDGKGRHTTVARRLIALPWGALAADMPGIREVQLWGNESALDASFPDIAGLARSCRFADCSHSAEPGCAVRAALEDGSLLAERYEAWQALQKELRYLERRTDPMAAREERAKWKAINKSMRGFRKGGWER